MKANDVALWFLNRNGHCMGFDETNGISNSKLQKLLYFAQGTSLIMKNKKLFDEKIVANINGVVVESVNDKYRENGWGVIRQYEKIDYSNLTEEEEDLLEDVYDLFGRYTERHLVTMLFEDKAWGASIDGIIDTDLMKKHFNKKQLYMIRKERKMNWKNRIKNKTTLLSLVTLTVTFIYQTLAMFSIIPKISPNEIIETVGVLVNILALIGVVVDPNTKGVRDNEDIT